MTVRQSPTGGRGVGLGVDRPAKWFIAAYDSPAYWYFFTSFGEPITIGPTMYMLNNYITVPPGDDVLFLDETGLVGRTFSVGGVGYSSMSGFRDQGLVFVGTRCTMFNTDLTKRWSRYSSLSTGTTSAAVHMMSDGVVHWSNGTDTLSKLSLTDGSTLWATGGVTSANMIRSDASGNVYTKNATTSLSKWDSTGTHQWTRIFTANIRQFDVNKSTGDVAVTYGSGGNMYTALVNTSGTQQWVRSLAVAGAGSSGVAIDKAGSVYTVGYVTSGATAGHYVAKYTSSGTLSFHRKIALTSNAVSDLTSYVGIDSKERLIFALGLYPYILRLPTSVPLGTYAVNSDSFVISAGALTASTPAHTLTNGTFTSSTANPLTLVDSTPYSLQLNSADVLADTYRGVKI